MENQKIEIPESMRPRTPCDECFSDSQRTFGQVGKVVMCYCPHNRSGAILFFKDGQPLGFWRVCSPITFKEFTEYMNTLSAAFATITKQGEQVDANMEKFLESMPSDKLSQA